MNTILKKIKTILWFLKRPKYIPHVFQVLRRKMNEEMEDSRKASTAWCKANVLSVNKALMKLNSSEECQELSELYPEIIKQAETTQRNCPLKMGGQGAISFIYQLCIANGVKIAVESGVAYGWSSLAILLAIKEEDGAFLISNDMPYIKMNNDDFVGCIVPNFLRKKWELQRLPDLKGIPKAFKKLNRKVDFFHYDSDKSYTGRMWASPLIWENLKDGGLYVSDDINDNLAFKHFAESVNREAVIIEHLGKYVGVIRK